MRAQRDQRKEKGVPVIRNPGPVGKDVSLQGGVVIRLLHGSHQREGPHRHGNGGVRGPGDSAVQSRPIVELVRGAVQDLLLVPSVFYV